MPPDIKVLEAAGALGDGRVHVEPSGGLVRAKVVSSTGERTYTVVLRASQRGASMYAYSDDNGTRYRGYIGYPIIAVMMHQGMLPRNHQVEEALRGIPWKELNEKYKKYSLTKEHVLEAASRLVPVDVVLEFVADVMDRLRGYTIYYDPSLAPKRP